MRQYALDWLGRGGPYRLRVALSPEKVRAAIRKSLVTESGVWSTLSFDRKYFGSVSEDRFAITPCKRGRRPQPTLRGTMAPEDEGTQIEFTIEIDPMLSAFVVLVPIVLGFCVVAGLVVLSGAIEVPQAAGLVACAPVLFIPLTGLGLLTNYLESKYLLEFFLECVRNRRENRD
jgi:hypothetical protein